MKLDRSLQFLVVVIIGFFVLISCQSIDVPIQTVIENSTVTLATQPSNIPATVSQNETISAFSSTISSPTLTETLIQETPLPPIPAVEIAVSLPHTQVNLGQLYFYGYPDYGWFELIANNTLQGLTFDNSTEYQKQSSSELLDGPGQSKYLEFSHYSNQIAFWGEASQAGLWISDLSYQNPQQLLMDSVGIYVPENTNPQEEIRIIWSSDDLHIFLYHRHQPELSRVYHLTTNQSEEWYWNCDSIVFSSMSGRLATLCPQIANIPSRQKMYAILEWGGEIWFSDTLPGEIFLTPLFDDTALWQWSSNGELLAYFDPKDTDDHLFIADAQGNIQKFLPGSSLFKDSEGEGHQPQYDIEISPDESPFVWAQDASVLLVNGFGQPDYPCPPFVTPFNPNVFYVSWPCWQALNVNTGSIIWTEASLAKSLSLTESGDDPVNMGISEVTFAPDGRVIGIHSFYPEPRIMVVNLQTSQAITVFRFDSFSHIYWAKSTEN